MAGAKVQGFCWLRPSGLDNAVSVSGYQIVFSHVSTHRRPIESRSCDAANNFFSVAKLCWVGFASSSTSMLRLSSSTFFD
jgi:hypothetical protein